MRDLDKAAIIGAGVIGASWSALFLAAGARVAVFDPQPGAEKAVRDYVAGAAGRGIAVIIAAAGGAAHLAGVTAAETLLPVLGVPIQSKTLDGLDSLLSTVQMPAGIPVGTLAIGKAGAVNAAMFAAAILGIRDSKYQDAIAAHRRRRADAILAIGDPALAT